MLKLIEGLFPLTGKFVALNEIEGASIQWASGINFWWNDGELLCQSENGWIPAEGEYDYLAFKYFVISEDE